MIAFTYPVMLFLIHGKHHSPAGGYAGTQFKSRYDRPRGSNARDRIGCGILPWQRKIGRCSVSNGNADGKHLCVTEYIANSFGIGNTEHYHRLENVFLSTIWIFIQDPSCIIYSCRGNFDYRWEIFYFTEDSHFVWWKGWRISRSWIFSFIGNFIRGWDKENN